ncbi:hypothetical protein ACFPM2_29920 [Azospirillum picis]
MSGRFSFGLKAVMLGALVAGSMLGASISPAAAHDDRYWGRDHGREWYGPGRGPEWRRWDRPRHHHWRERGVVYAPGPVIIAPPPPPRVIYAPPPVIYAPPVAPGFGFSVNIR